MLVFSDQGEAEVPGNETTYAFRDTPPYTEYTVCVAITKGAEGSVCCDHITAEDGELLSRIVDGFALYIVSAISHFI